MTTSYDPRACGALCDKCPLNGKQVVPPEGPAGALFAIVGEAPGEEEERQGRPFIGPSGEVMEDALRVAGYKRRDVLITNTLLCRPDKNELSLLLRQVNKRNKEIDLEYEASCKEAIIASLPAPPKPEHVPSPLDCCAPRLKRELASIPNRITLGKTATSALTGSNAGILSLRGGVVELTEAETGRPLKTMPTVHPAFALRQRRWLHVFTQDVHKAVLWFQGMANWEPPEFVWNPSPEQLEAFLASEDTFAWDLETDGIEPLECRIRCICFATPKTAYVVSFLGKDGFTRFYSEVDERRILTIIKVFLLNPLKVKVGHNTLNYDSAVTKSNWGIVPVNQVDTLLIHRNVESELPHGLAFVGTMYSLAPNWKVNKDGQKLSTEAQDDRELAAYCGNDGSVNIRVLPPLIEKLQGREQVHIWEMDQKVQDICREMHEVGMYVHQPTRLANEKKMLGLRHQVLVRIRDFIGNKDFNPGSIRQLQSLLFDDWGLDPQLDPEDKYTGTAQKLENFGWDGISTGDLILRALLFDPAVPEDKRNFIKLLRRYRKLMKLLGTYVCKLRYKYEFTELGWDEDADDDDSMLAAWADSRRRYGLQRTGIVDPRTGRMHPGYSAGVAVTGRLASSRPINCFDGSTEVLTRNGWVRFDALDRGVEIAQWHESGLIDFAVPTAYHEGFWEGEMVAFASQASDLLMTPNHRIPIRGSASGKLRTITADQLVDLGAGTSTIHGGHLVDGDTHSPLTLPEIRMLVALQADGWVVQKNGVPSFWDVGFSKTRKIIRFEALLQELRIPHRKKVQGKKHRYYISWSDWDPGKILGPDRMWGPWLLQLSRLQRETFCDEVFFWDGSHATRSDYANKVKTNADWVQTMLCLTDRRGSLRHYTNAQGHSVHICTHRRTPLNAVTNRSKRNRVQWVGQVFCVTMPSDAVLVRRNGKVTVTRQSQNFPSALRKMIHAAPGHVLVGADMDQLELRIAAAVWQVKLYLRAFAEGKDPHSMTAFAIFGEAFCKAAQIDPRQFRSDWSLPFSGGAYDENGGFDKDKASAEAQVLRHLGKTTQYASVSSREHVVTLDSRGSAPIEDLRPGDWTWTWSTRRACYEPSEITAVIQRTEKSCLRVTFGWGNGARWKSSMVVTPDHRCMMRDGSYRRADALKPGDALMPFYRHVSQTIPGRYYRRIAPLNDGRYTGEHRVVRGYCEPGEDGDIHVHHKNGDTLDNVPSNLEPMNYLDHYEEHKEDLDMARILSAKWQEAVRDPDTRSKASFKSWDNRRAKVAAGLPDGGFGPKTTLFDAHLDIVGKLPDDEVAAIVGCTPQAVVYFRKTRGIALAPGSQGWLRDLLQIPEWKSLFKTMTDTEIVEKVNTEFGVSYTRTAVGNTRRLLGEETRFKRSSKELELLLYENRERVGQESDTILARGLGIAPGTIRRYREKHGIPAYWKEASGGNNHCVISVEPAGDHETWDIEVDHEDHNFALAAGVFVHNSQYMGSDETVHKVIQKTEVAALGKDGKPLDDGTTDLPYAKQSLKETRRMRKAWLKGAPEFEAGWGKEIAEFDRLGYLAEPVLGRRRDFLDGIEKDANAVVNFKIQSAAASIVNKIMLDLRSEIDFEKWGPGTGLINQCHDSIIVEVPADGVTFDDKGKPVGDKNALPFKVAALMNEVMNRKEASLPGVTFTTQAKVGKTWKDV